MRDNLVIERPRACTPSLGRVVLSILAAGMAGTAHAQMSPTISTFAGTGNVGGAPGGDGGPAIQADLGSLGGDIAADRWGNLYFTEESAVRRVDALTGTITTVAGGGAISEAPDGTPATDAQINAQGIAVDHDGNVYFGVYGGAQSALIRRVDAVTGLLSTYAGGGTTMQFHQVVFALPFVHVIYSVPLPAGDGGPATSAYLAGADHLVFDTAGNLFFADRFQVRRIDAQTGTITTAAGNGQAYTLFYSPAEPTNSDNIVVGVSSGDGGPATSAGIEYLGALALDPAGNLYIYDIDIVPEQSPVTGLRVRRVDAQSGIIDRYAGDGSSGFSGDSGPAALAQIGDGYGLAADAAGNLFISDGNNGVIRKVDASTGVISTVAGTPQGYGFGGDGGPALGAVFSYPGGLAFDPAGNLYIVDWDAYRIRKVTGLSSDSPPTASAGPDQSIHAGQVVDLDGLASFDDNTTTHDMAFEWTLLSRPPGSAATLDDPALPTPSFTADKPGAYTVQLVVRDASNQSSQPDEVIISSTNLAPTADAGFDQVVAVGMAATLDGSASSDPELDGLSYSWFVSQSPAGSSPVLLGAFLPQCALVPDAPGSYVVSLVVDDGFGPSSPEMVLVTCITGEAFVANTAASVIAQVQSLPPDAVASPGNARSFVTLLTKAVQDAQNGKVTKAINDLQAALERTDGCVLRGQPDTKGAGRDWITDCDAQAPIYQQVLDAIEAISP